jgi:hypothetical protein
MDHLVRLQLAGRVTYYLGWISALCGALAHFSLVTRVFVMAHITKRNLFEASVLFFLICTASELRALGLTRTQEPSVVPKKQAA